MKVKAKLKFGKKTQYIIFIDNIRWGILKRKVLQSFSKKLEWDIENTERELLISEIRKFAIKRFYDYLAYRERSIKEVTQFFRKLPVHETISNELIKKAIDKKLISDSRYAEIKIRSLISKKKSKNEIVHQLKRDGINLEKINQLINNYYTEEIESEIINYQLEKVKKRYSKYPKKKAQIKAYQSLLRKGFSNEILAQYFNE